MVNGGGVGRYRTSNNKNKNLKFLNDPFIELQEKTRLVKVLRLSFVFDPYVKCKVVLYSLDPSLAHVCGLD
jgi:hypothetical protein